MILVDDMALSDLANMPQTKALLGDAGTTFTRTLSPYPLCCPARATILTGQYAHNHKVMGNSRPLGGFPAFRDRHALPVWLKSAGYRTIMVGKYLNLYVKRPSYVPRGWSYWAGLNHRVYDYMRTRMNVNGTDREINQFQTDYMASMVANRIRVATPRKQPFFLWASFVTPHNGVPRTDNDTIDVDAPYVEPEYQNTFAGVPQPRGASFNEWDMSDKPARFQGLEPVDPAYATEVWQQRQEALQSADDAVARIVAQLRASGELKNTIIAFTSDNGYLIGQHRRVGKTVAYEESVRVPLLVRGPGFPAGRVVRQQTSLADLAPTFLSAAKARADVVVDGLPLQRLAANPNTMARRSILVEAAPTAGQIRLGAPMDAYNRMYVGVRTARDDILIWWADGAREYYDMRTDPYQVNNRYDDPAVQDRVAKLKVLLREMRNCRGRDCRVTR
jgi:arylsulfatase A-like enzyme